MLGAIAGDVIGSIYEWHSVKTTDFQLLTWKSGFTDDTVLTVAVAAAILEGRDYAEALRDFARRYPERGYGANFQRWMMDDRMGPYGSWGNGSAMRVSPVAWAFDTEVEVLAEAKCCASVTHDHAEGIRGAQAVALAILRARTGGSKNAIRTEITERFGYDLDRRIDDIRPHYGFDVSCQGSVPESILCFLESHDFESAVRLAVSLGGDADTMACIAGSIAEAFYGGVPDPTGTEVLERLRPDLLEVVERFRLRHVTAR